MISTEEDLAKAVAAADDTMALCGGATRGMAGDHGPPLSLSGLSGIVRYDPGALTVVARAGTPLEDIAAALRSEGQMLAFEPMDHRPLLGTTGTPTIGGVVAGNVSGPRRVQVGAARDFMLGVRFVDGIGRVIVNGGRVMKNVTGYDLVRLMSGSRGRLGALTEVSLKVLPAPRAAATLILEGLSPDAAVLAMSGALGSPFDVSGAAHLAGDSHEAAKTLIRVEGFEASVRYRANRLGERLGEFGTVRVEEDPAAHDALWASVRDVTPLAEPGPDIWRVSVRPSDAPRVLDRVKPLRPPVLDWGGGLVWLAVAPGTDLRADLAGLAGHATIVRADAATRATLGVLHPEPPALAALTAGLCAKFDPRGVFGAATVQPA